MTEKPSQNEDEYFKKLDTELLEKQRTAQHKASEAAEKQSHFGRCPRCGGHLVTHKLHDVEIDQCPDCSGIWLDNGELETLVHHQDPGLITRFFGDLFRSYRKK